MPPQKINLKKRGYTNNPQLINSPHKFLLDCKSKVDLYKSNNPRKSKIWFHAACKISNGNYSYYQALKNLRYFPVSAKQFLEDSEFLGQRDNIYPAIKEKFIECNPDILAGEKPVYQVIDTGAIGVGKSYSMILNCIYTIYLMCCFKDPRKLFGLDKDTELVAILVGDGSFATKVSLYEPARKMFLEMPFISKRKSIGFDNSIDSMLRLDNGITLTPQLAGSNEWKKAIAIFFAGLDESNHQAVIARSKKSAPGQQVYDQARENYDTTWSRMLSRFGNGTLSFMKMFIAGSARVKTSMIEGVMNELESSGSKEHRIYRNRQFDIRPKHNYSGKKFRFCLSTEKYRAHVIKKHEASASDMWIMDDCPVEYEPMARMNPDKFQRDVLGYPTDSINSFIGDNQAVTDAFADNVKSIVFKNNVILGLDADPDTYFKINEDNLPSLNFRKTTPHWIHIDGSKSTCSTGIAMTYISHVESIGKTLQANFKVPLCASIIPANNQDIRMSIVRAFIVMLRDTYHYNIAGISFDSFNSIESIQILSGLGFNVTEISTVRTPQAYNDLKEAILSRRIKISSNDIAERECKELEIIEQGDRTIIDHPISGSKDISDSLAASINYALQSTYFAKLKLEYQRSKSIPRDYSK